MFEREGSSCCDNAIAPPLCLLQYIEHLQNWMLDSLDCLVPSPRDQTILVDGTLCPFQYSKDVLRSSKVHPLVLITNLLKRRCHGDKHHEEFWSISTFFLHHVNVPGSCCLPPWQCDCLESRRMQTWRYMCSYVGKSAFAVDQQDGTR